MASSVWSSSSRERALRNTRPGKAGYHRLYWDGRDDAGRRVASGIYLYKLATDFGILTRKLMLLR